MNLPDTQTAVQLVGAKQLSLNGSKPLTRPGRHQYLVRTEAVGLCFSDMKLLSQFSGHVRKSQVVEGVDPEVLEELPSYVPDLEATVPGHEVCCTVVAIGDGVLHYRVGDRFIVQADYRPLKTAASNGAFGYNFEGGLQEFVLLDERITGDPKNEASFMIPVPSDAPASQLALVEPWACVENSYASQERTSPLEGGVCLVIHREGSEVPDLSCLPDHRILTYGEVKVDLESVDDLILVAPTAEQVEESGTLLAKFGRMAILQQGRALGRKVKIDVGRLHYMGQRFVGSQGANLAEAYGMIQPTGELMPKDRILIVGAGGPMGQMHTIRSLATGEGEVVATDTSNDRLAALAVKLGSWPGRWQTCLAGDLALHESFDLVALMAPVPGLVQEAIERSRPNGKVNVFAGIPVGTIAELDLDSVIKKRVFLFGTSGSEPKDMRVVLEQTLGGTLDTNLSVAAVSGMAGAIDGLRAVEERTLEGKIVVYPTLTALPLIPLGELDRWYPTVAALLKEGQWTSLAESELLRVAR